MSRAVRFGLLVSGLFLVGVLQTAQAQSVQIGYTDPQLIVAQMPEYEDILSRMQSQYQGSQKEYQQLIQEFQKKQQDFQEKQSLMSEETRQKRKQELQQMQQKIQQFLQRTNQEMSQKEAELMEPLLEKVQGAIDKVAEENNLDLVLTSRSGSSPVILYAGEGTVDITEEVMNQLGVSGSNQNTDVGAVGN